jgi:hypothetical protein
MPSVYLDQNALINAGLKASSDASFHTKFHGALANQDFEVVLSAWHWVEAARGTNRASASRLADFMDSLNPRWLRERRDLERIEVHTAFFGFCGIPFDPPSPTLTRVELIAQLNRVPVHASLDRSSRASVEGWIDNPGSMRFIIRSYEANADAIRNLRKAIAEGRVTSAIKREGDRRLIEGFLPTHTPAGVQLDRDVWNQFLDSARVEQFPSISIESAIAKHSWADTAEPDWNSMVDRIHLISALPYVDVVVSNDDYFHLLYRVASKTAFVRARVLNFADFCSQFI